jgi:hypothetical protein
MHATDYAALLLRIAVGTTPITGVAGFHRLHRRWRRGGGTHSADVLPACRHLRFTGRGVLGKARSSGLATCPRVSRLRCCPART